MIQHQHTLVYDYSLRFILACQMCIVYFGTPVKNLFILSRRQIKGKIPNSLLALQTMGPTVAHSAKHGTNFAKKNRISLLSGINQLCDSSSTALQGRGEGGQGGQKLGAHGHKGPMNNNSVFQIWLKLRSLSRS